MFWAGKTTHQSLRTLHGEFSLPQTQVVKSLHHFRDVACSLFLWGKKKIKALVYNEVSYYFLLSF